jgi:hypothetical protein
MRRWVLLEDSQYDVLVSYVLLSYRLHDASFDFIPYLRFYGQAGTGKGRALDVIRFVCWRSFSTQPTADNIHRLVHYFGDITLGFDEFHLDRGRGQESQERMIDALNLGNQRGTGKLRMVKDSKGVDQMQHFDMFGLKVFAGYGHDEHEALARRTVNVEMVRRDVPESMSPLSLPDEFYLEAAELRARLLSWRGRKLALGKPDPHGERAKQLSIRVGHESAQVFWPLVEMVPASMTQELENLLVCGVDRKKATQKAREVSDDSYLLDAFARVIDESQVHRRRSGALVVTTADVHELVQDSPALKSAVHVARRLTALGLKHKRCMVDTPGGIKAKRGCIVFREDDPKVAALFKHYGIDWPRQVDATERDEPAI